MGTQLRSIANATRPVNRLPQDVLNEIFSLFHPRTLRRYLPLVHATHVCHLWRNIILSTPNNWTWISPTCGDLLPLLLRRSEPAPIEVDISDLGKFNTGFIDNLLPHCKRFVSFTMIVSVTTIGFCSRVASMPNLRVLSITTGLGIPSYPLPFLSGSMPHLKSIILPFFVCWKQVVQLAHLTAINITVHHSSLTNVVQLFANNPKLTTASLSGSFRETECQRHRSTARMNHLRQLDLLSWNATSLLPFLVLNINAHILLRPSSALGIGDTLYLPLINPTSFPNLANLQKLHCHIRSDETSVKFTGPNGSLSILLPYPETHVSTRSFLPVGSIEELYMESNRTPVMAYMQGPSRVISSLIPTMNQLRKVTFATCPNFIIHIVLSKINRVSPLKAITLLHCDHRDPYGYDDILHKIFLFAKGRVSIDAKLEEVRVISRTCAQQGQPPNHKLIMEVVESLVLLDQ